MAPGMYGSRQDEDKRRQARPGPPGGLLGGAGVTAARHRGTDAVESVLVICGSGTARRLLLYIKQPPCCAVAHPS